MLRWSTSRSATMRSGAQTKAFVSCSGNRRFLLSRSLSSLSVRTASRTNYRQALPTHLRGKCFMVKRTIRTEKPAHWCFFPYIGGLKTFLTTWCVGERLDASAGYAYHATRAYRAMRASQPDLSRPAMTVQATGCESHACSRRLHILSPLGELNFCMLLKHSK